MNTSLFQEFSKIVSWRRGSERAPHKPLLILYALGALSRGQEQLRYSEIETPLTELLRDFGPSRARLHPEYPFVRLKNDGIWILYSPTNLQFDEIRSDHLLSEMRGKPLFGSFRPDIVQNLKKSTNLLARLVQQILEKNFPVSLHEELIDRCGIESRTIYYRKHRNPEFRRIVLEAYGYRCAVCGHSMRLKSQFLALEAAHIKWHALGGQDDVSNGLALCSTHHKLFDFGAFGIRHGVIEYSEVLVGNHALDFHLENFHGQQIGLPVNPNQNPLIENVNWHYVEVFKTPSRN